MENTDKDIFSILEETQKENQVQVIGSEYEEDETIDENSELDENDSKSLIYKTRVRNLIKSVAQTEEYEIKIGKKGFERLNDSIKFLAVMLSYEIIDELKSKKRKTLSPPFVDEALSNMLGKADALSLAIKELEKVVEELEVKSSTTSISKAMDFLNILVVQESDGSKVSECQEEEPK
jgi:hypothetical protein